VTYTACWSGPSKKPLPPSKEKWDGPVKTMKPARTMTVFVAALLPIALTIVAGGCNSCKKDDDDKPATTASAAPPAPTPTPVAPATVVPEEDAGAPVDAGVDAAKPTGPGGPGPGSIAKCCAALQQNVNSAPLEQKAYYMAAAQYCQGLKNTPAAQQAFAQIRSFLAGAKMPAACR
jgi:hypothetical protein